MSRALKRVPLDFAHPVGEVWSGYVNDVGRACEACGGGGATKARTGWPISCRSSCCRGRMLRADAATPTS